MNLIIKEGKEMLKNNMKDKSYMMKASMTVEAAIVLPLLLFFFINLMSSIEMMRLHSNLQLALWETGYRMTIYNYAYETLKDGMTSKGEDFNQLLEGAIGVVYNNLFARNEVIDYVGEEYLMKSPLTYGADGLIFLESSIMERDYVDLAVTYEVSAPIQFVGFPSFRMSNRFYGKAWTGYTILEDDVEKEEDIVYVTEHGSVYHTTRECSYLKRLVETVSSLEVHYIRNETGQNYSLCSLCKNSPVGRVVYITAGGFRYHLQKNCTAITRMIIPIDVDSARQYRPCNRCGNH